MASRRHTGNTDACAQYNFSYRGHLGPVRYSRTIAIGPAVVRPAGISVISGTYSSTVDFWIMYKNLQIHAMRATFHMVFSVRI